MANELTAGEQAVPQLNQMIMSSIGVGEEFADDLDAMAIKAEYEALARSHQKELQMKTNTSSGGGVGSSSIGEKRKSLVVEEEDEEEEEIEKTLTTTKK